MKPRILPTLAKLNHLTYGDTCRAVTPTGSTTGEYLGVETTRGVWFALFRHRRGTDSIPVDQIESVVPAAI
jgi:hypothetical protein